LEPRSFGEEEQPGGDNGHVVGEQSLGGIMGSGAFPVSSTIPVVQNVFLVVAGALVGAGVLSVWVRRDRLGLRPRTTRLGWLAMVAFGSLVALTLATDVVPDEVEPLADYVFIAIGSLAIVAMVLHAMWTEPGRGD
jgi:hypothetical protein